MKWRGRRQSSNIEDRRGSGGGGSFGRRGFSLGGGGGRRIGLGGGAGGLGLIVIIVVAVLLGVDPTQFLTGEQAPRERAPVSDQAPQSGAADPLRDFVAVVLADTEDVWHTLFQQQFGRPYPEPSLVLFSDGVRSACGFADSAVGPFYCPGDRKVYLDLDFFRALKERFAAPGDFAQAYVIAHEVGHHVQNVLGISDEVRKAQRGLPAARVNALSVRLELQADCLAGVWASHA
jgi:predicted metalloprotease